MQNICNLIGWNSVHISDIFNCYSANINGMWNARKWGGIYKTFESILTQNIYVCIGYINTWYFQTYTVFQSIKF